MNQCLACYIFAPFSYFVLSFFVILRSFLPDFVISCSHCIYWPRFQSISPCFSWQFSHFEQILLVCILLSFITFLILPSYYLQGLSKPPVFNVSHRISAKYCWHHITIRFRCSLRVQVRTESVRENKTVLSVSHNEGNGIWSRWWGSISVLLFYVNFHKAYSHECLSFFHHGKDSVFNYMYIIPCIFTEFLVFESIKC